MKMMGMRTPAVGELPLKLEAADARQRDIEDKTTRTIRFLVAQELFGSCKGLGLKAHRLQQPLNGRTHIYVVVNDEHCRFHSERSFLLQSEACQNRGHRVNCVTGDEGRMAFLTPPGRSISLK